MTRQQQLLAWYEQHRRSLPWRQIRDPYRIMVSEVMLQQTQAERVIPFFECFLARFPDAAALAAADADTLHRLWKGLGYPSRADRLQAACRQVLEQDAWPKTAVELQQLPGIGPYTAAAVACFAFGQPEAVVDTNVARVYARRDGLRLPVDKKAIWQHAQAELSQTDPIAYNNALMELGATICTAKAVYCERCPWARRCVRKNDDAALLASANPLKVASRRQRYGEAPPAAGEHRQHIVLGLIHHDGRYLVARRPPDKHQGGFWELPGGKRDVGEDDRVALARELREELDVELLAARPFVDYFFRYPDRLLQFHVYRCRLFDPGCAKPMASTTLRWVTPAEFMRLAFPAGNAAIQARFRDYHRLP
jgi:A/G-specific adenine glycosylase